MLYSSPRTSSWLLPFLSLTVCHKSLAFVARPTHNSMHRTSSAGTTSASTTLVWAAPRRLEDNVEGVLYVNDRCINCAACSNFSPDVFGRSDRDTAHIVHHQPSSEHELETARAALAACPVAAIRVENSAQRRHGGGSKVLSANEQELARQLALNPKVNDRPFPFPRPLLHDDLTVTDDDDDDAQDKVVYFVGHHNEGSFGATPYLVSGNTNDHHSGNNDDNKKAWVLVDTPKFGPSAVRAVTGLTGPNGPDYLFLTHVDDTADHHKWKEEFPNLKRIFHEGDTGRYNWLGDSSLDNVEVLLKGKQSHDDDDDDEDLTMWNLDGTTIRPTTTGIMQGDFVVVHTPGHSYGSISLYHKPSKVLFTGDTYAFTTRTHRMSGFPRYGRDLRMQSKTLQKLLSEDFVLEWDVIAPGHGHPRDYRSYPKEERQRVKQRELEEALHDMKASAGR